MNKILAGTIFGALGLFAGGPAYAGGEIFDSFSTCTGASCGSVVEGGTIKAFPPSAGKWVAEVFAQSGECLRIAVLSEYADLLAVVVAPNGVVFRDDDGGGSNRPLVRIDPTPNNGWYTVSIGRFSGVADTGNFTVAYGRYNHSNPNCAGPTPPLGRALPAKAGASAVTAPAAGEPGAE